jgi:hypothetical protein
MRAFFDRYLPASERRTALWLALGGAAMAWSAGEIADAVWSQWPASAAGADTAMYGVQVFAAFAMVTLLVAVMIRVARAPRALALYVALGAALDSAIRIIGLPGDLLAGSMLVAAPGGSPNDALVGAAVSVLTFMAVAAGAVTGAWVAQTVSLARIRDEGFSGDDSEDGVGLKRRPGSSGWSFMGWTGRPISGDGLLAVGFVAVGVIPSLVGVAFSLIQLPLMPWLEEHSAFLLVSAVSTLLLAGAWYFSARLVTLRTGVVSLWAVPAAGLLMSLMLAIQLALRGLGGLDFLVSAGLGLLAAGLAAAAALLGTAHALRAKPATLSAPDQQDPGARALDDTAGG